MKKLTYLMCILIFIGCSRNHSIKSAQIFFENPEHNFGQLSYKLQAEHDFVFSNPGKTPIIISKITTSCGCVIVEWSKKPVKPGKKGSILVKYNSAFHGMFFKTIKVHFNGEDSPVSLFIKGQVDFHNELE